ncbi:MAG: hypothetical protein JHC81_03625 [Brevundimonas sp.]|nr:hypothetical protein [Brevundimonas sp.]
MNHGPGIPCPVRGRFGGCPGACLWSVG